MVIVVLLVMVKDLNSDADCAKARGMVRNIDPNNDLTFIRIRSKKNEILIAPGEAHLLLDLGRC